MTPFDMGMAALLGAMVGYAFGYWIATERAIQTQRKMQARLSEALQKQYNLNAEIQRTRNDLLNR